MIHRFPILDSTNTTAKAMALEGAAHGTVVVADQQTAGRGRMGRSFDSPAGSGIYMSMILRPQCPPTELMHLTCAVAVAVCHGIRSALALRPQIKWINDIVAEGKKLGGILTELSINPKTGLVDFAILGIGINCNRNPEDFPPELENIACSASMLLGHPVDTEVLLEALISSLMDMDLSKREAIMTRYCRDCITLGKDVQVIRQDDIRSGFALDVDNQGALVVYFPDGHTEHISSGEVSVRGLYGYI